MPIVATVKLGRRMVVVIVLAVHLVMLVVLVVVMVTAAHERPDEEPHAGEDQDDADDVSLLGLEGTAKLYADRGDDGGDEQGGENVPHRGKEAHPSHTGSAPPPRSADNRQRQPVTRQDRVQKADGAAGNEERDR